MSRKEGVALDEGDKGQEIVPVASASGGKEQEGYPGWSVYVCVLCEFPLSTLLPHICLLGLGIVLGPGIQYRYPTVPLISTLLPFYLFTTLYTPHKIKHLTCGVDTGCVSLASFKFCITDVALSVFCVEF